MVRSTNFDQRDSSPTAINPVDVPTKRRRILRWWPTLLAFGAGLSMYGVGQTDEGTVSMAELLMLLPLVYLVLAVLRRRGASWIVLVCGFGMFAALRGTDIISTSTGVVLAALIALIWGASQSEVRRSPQFMVQSVGMAAFAGVALISFAVDPELARYVVGAGWLLHGCWDLWHLRTNTVVSRSYAHWCGVLDVLIGLQLLFAI